MKRTLSVFLVVATVLLVLPRGTAMAEERELVSLEDGAYIEVIMDSISSVSRNSITRSKSYIYNANGSVEWKITLTGTFANDGVKYTCTESDCTVNIYKSNWYVDSKSSSKSGNTAYATVTMGYKVLVTVNRQTYNLTLTCDKDGNVS